MYASDIRCAMSSHSHPLVVTQVLAAGRRRWARAQEEFITARCVIDRQALHAPRCVVSPRSPAEMEWHAPIPFRIWSSFMRRCADT